MIVGAGFGFRALAGRLLGFVPFAGWAVKGAIAYARHARASARRRVALLRGALRDAASRTRASVAASRSVRRLPSIAVDATGGERRWRRPDSREAESCC